MLACLQQNHPRVLWHLKCFNNQMMHTEIYTVEEIVHINADISDNNAKHNILEITACKNVHAGQNCIQNCADDQMQVFSFIKHFTQKPLYICDDYSCRNMCHAYGDGSTRLHLSAAQQCLSSMFIIDSRIHDNKP